MNIYLLMTKTSNTVLGIDQISYKNGAKTAHRLFSGVFVRSQPLTRNILGVS